MKRRKGDDEIMVSYIKEYNSRHFDEAFSNRLIPVEIVFYRRGKREMEKPFTVQVNDTSRIEMNPNSFYKFQSLGDTVSLCINGQCEKIPLVKKQINYVQCIWRTNAIAPELRKVDRKVGEFYIKEVELHISKKDKE